MPTITDSEGNVVAKLPYDSEGEAQAEKLVEANQDLKIDYGENNVVNAPDMRESYQMGGLIPGLDKGFGQKPKIGQNLGINPMQGMYEEGGEIPKYKKGGKVKK